MQSLLQKKPIQPDANLFDTLTHCIKGLDTTSILSKLILEIFHNRIAVVSSFGAESAILLDQVARIDKNIPILFIDTKKHFPETLEYRDILIDRLGLTNVQSIEPDVFERTTEDDDGMLWQRNHDGCCNLRKVRPLDKALKGYDAWISGRKRFHGGGRETLPIVEALDDKIKINPLANWPADEIENYFTNFGLPRHPLFNQGYLSIGCATCTQKPTGNDDPRSGRWSGSSKVECGIHKSMLSASL